jgi:hypothetical protein
VTSGTLLSILRAVSARELVSSAVVVMTRDCGS